MPKDKLSTLEFVAKLYAIQEMITGSVYEYLKNGGNSVNYIFI